MLAKASVSQENFACFCSFTKSKYSSLKYKILLFFYILQISDILSKYNLSMIYHQNKEYNFVTKSNDQLIDLH